MTLSVCVRDAAEEKVTLYACSLAILVAIAANQAVTRCFWLANQDACFIRSLMDLGAMTRRKVAPLNKSEAANSLLLASS